MLAELEERAKLGGKAEIQNLKVKPRSSDEVETFKFSVKWEPEKGALGVLISPEDATVPPEELFIVSIHLCIFV